MVKGVIFDLDGTVIDSMPVWDNAAKIFLKNNYREADDRLNKDLETLSMLEGAEYLKKHYSLPMEEKKIISEVNKVVRDLYHKHVTIKKGADAFLRELKENGIRIVAATSSDREVATNALKNLCIIEYFEKIFTCTEENTNKEKPDIFLKAAKFINKKPEEVFVFEDALYAIKTANKAGFRTVGIFDVSNKYKQEEIKNISDFYLENYLPYQEFVEMIKEKKDEYSVNDSRK